MYSWGFTLTETVLSGPSSCTVGELIDITLRIGMEPIANERFDIGVFVGDSGEPAIGGSSCTFSSLTPQTANPSIADLISGVGPYRDLDLNGNACGDALSADGEIFRDIVLTDVLCQDQDGGGELDVSYAVAWKQSAGICTDPNSAAEFINTSSKVNIQTPTDKLDN